MDTPPNADTIVAARHRIRQEALGAAWIVAEEMPNPTAHMITSKLKCIRPGIIQVLRDQMNTPQEEASAAADILIRQVSDTVMERMRKSDFEGQHPDVAAAKLAALGMFRHELDEQRQGVRGSAR